MARLRGISSLLCAVLAGCPAPATPVGGGAAAGATSASGRPAPSPPAPPEDWLVWHRGPRGYETAWIEDRGGRTTVIARRHAPILADGARLWRIDARPGGAIATVELLGGEHRELVPASGAAVTLLGSSGATLLLAHDGGVVVLDVASGAPVGDAPAALGGALPEPWRREAATQLLPAARACDPATSIEALLAGQMTLVGVGLEVDDAALRTSWRFGTAGCAEASPRATVHGEFVPAAAPLGLGGPPPAAAVHVAVEVGQSPALGFGRLSLRADARADALVRFGSADEPAWP